MDRAEPSAEEKYDFKSIQNIDCYNTDFCVKVRHGMRYWNMTVQWWLHHYIYANAPFKSYTLRWVKQAQLILEVHYLSNVWGHPKKESCFSKKAHTFNQISFKMNRK